MTVMCRQETKENHNDCDEEKHNDCDVYVDQREAQ